MNWFERIKTRFRGETLPENQSKCNSCGYTEQYAAWSRNLNVCVKCGHHNPIDHTQYVDLLIDSDTFTELDPKLTAIDPLNFKDHKKYSDRLRESRKASAMNEAVYTGLGRIGGNPVGLGVMDTRFILGSLGAATGEKIARLVILAIKERRTLVMVCQSGGARMQESAYSLMQMAKISARLHQFSKAGLLYITLLTDPTYGGVTASFGMLGDIIVAEPGARIGFAGQSVIKQFLAIDQLPRDFQLAETVLDNGFIDCIVSRDNMAATLANLISLMAPSA